MCPRGRSPHSEKYCSFCPASGCPAPAPAPSLGVLPNRPRVLEQGTGSSPCRLGSSRPPLSLLPGRFHPSVTAVAPLNTPRVSASSLSPGRAAGTICHLGSCRNDLTLDRIKPYAAVCAPLAKWSGSPHHFPAHKSLCPPPPFWWGQQASSQDLDTDVS